MRLEPHDQLKCVRIAFRRFSNAVNKKIGQRYNATEPNFSMDYVAVHGECAISILTGYAWDGNPDDIEFNRKRNVGPYQVRSTDRPEGSLILHPDDEDHRVFIFVIVDVKRNWADPIGWIYGWEGKKPNHWRSNVPCPAYFVKQIFLHDMKDLP